MDAPMHCDLVEGERRAGVFNLSLRYALEAND